jgi:lipopolysaccharide transport system ATP-binding protein
VKTYSSGMYVRLAFATAVNVDPDVLVVDEALSVGDEAFQRKCFARIEAIQERGGTILFVSHATQTIVQLCNRAMLIDNGELLLDDAPKKVVGQYQRLINLTTEEGRSVREEIRGLGGHPPSAEAADIAVGDADDEPQAAQSAVAQDEPTISLEGYDPGLLPQSRVEYERHGAEIRDLRLLNAHGERVNVLEMGRSYTYEYYVDFTSASADVGFGMLINTTSGFGIGGATTAYSRALRMPRIEAGSRVRVHYDFNCQLLPGTYFLNAGVSGAADGETRFLHRVLDGLAFRVVAAGDVIATELVDLNFRPSIAVVPGNA